MKKMKKLAAALLALSCIFAVGGLTACAKKNSSATVKIQMDKLAMTLEVGDTQKLEPTLIGAEKMEFSSSNTDVVTVDAEGNVTAVGSGTAVITVTAGKVSQTCRINVVNIAVDEVYFTEDVKVAIGAEKELSVIVSPVIATDKRVTFTSANEDVATVDEKGIVKGVAEGETTITAKTVNGDKTATCKVTVGKKVEAISIKSNGVEVTEIPAILATKTAKLEAVIAPTDAIIQDVIWSSSNENVAVVGGGEVYGVSEGTATITATTVDGSKKATCKVTVEKFIFVESVTFDNANERLNMTKGEQMQLSAKVLPAEAMEPSLRWASSDPSVASVNENGEVVAHKAGSATIIAMNKNQRLMRDAVEINVIEGGAMFYNQYYAPTGTFSFKVYDVNEVKINGRVLAQDEYVYQDNVVTLPAQVIAENAIATDNKINFVSEESKNVDVPMDMMLAKGTNFDAGDLGTEIFTVNDAVLSSSVQSGEASFALAEGKTARIALNWDYLDAMFAYPLLEQLNIEVSVYQNISGKINIRLVKADDTWYNDGKTFSGSNVKLFISRVAYNKLKAEKAAGTTTNYDNNVWLQFEGGSVGADAVIAVTSVKPYYVSNKADDANRINRIFADKPADGKLTLALSSPATALTKFNIGGAELTAPAMDGSNLVTFTHSTNLNVYNRNNKRLWLQTNYGEEILWMHTALTPAATQTFAVGGSFTFNRPDGTLSYKVISATVNGEAIENVEGVTLVTDEKGAVGVQFENAGAYRLQVYAEKVVTYLSGSSEFRWTSFDTYDRQITVTAS